MTGTGQAREEVLSVDNLSKRFCRDLKRSLWYGIQDICREVAATRRDSLDLRKQEFWALKDVSLQVKRGECLGLVGANGAGKTTLLRIVSGLMKPDAGTVIVRGKTAPLLALGAGFNPILTGRENIFVNMAILGATKAQIQKAYDSVVSFAEIADAIDAPVLSYSSGMNARLGFSCAIHVQPEILIVDEVLSVGDMRFRAKCYRKLAELREGGTSILLVSHNSGAIIGICDRVAYLEKGCLKAVGETAKVVRMYEDELFGHANVEVPGELQLDPARDTSSGAMFERAYLTNESGVRVDTLTTGFPGAIKLDIKAQRAFTGASLLLIIRDIADQERVVLHISSDRDNRHLDIPAGNSTMSLDMPMVGLRPGTYMAKIALTRDNYYMYDAIETFHFRVISEQNFTSMTYYQPREWNISQRVASAAPQLEQASQRP